jgi:hypothetical protein
MAAPTKRRPKTTKPKLRGQKQPLAVALPPELVARVDALAKTEDRSRAKMVERLVRYALDHLGAAAV